MVRSGSSALMMGALITLLGFGALWYSIYYLQSRANRERLLIRHLTERRKEITPNYMRSQMIGLIIALCWMVAIGGIFFASGLSYVIYGIMTL
jgi:hypothetical protein